MKITIQYRIISFSVSNFMLDHDMTVFNSKLDRGMSMPSSRLGCDTFPPNSKLDQGGSVPKLILCQGHVRVQLNIRPGRTHAQPHVGLETHPAQLYVELWGIRAQSPVGSGTWTCPTPHWIVACPSLTIPGYSHKLNPTPLRLNVWVEPNIPQVECATERSLHTKHLIP